MTDLISQNIESEIWQTWSVKIENQKYDRHDLSTCRICNMTDLVSKIQNQKHDLTWQSMTWLVAIQNQKYNITWPYQSKCRISSMTWPDQSTYRMKYDLTWSINIQNEAWHNLTWSINIQNEAWHNLTWSINIQNEVWHDPTSANTESGAWHDLSNTESEAWPGLWTYRIRNTTWTDQVKYFICHDCSKDILSTGNTLYIYSQEMDHQKLSSRVLISPYFCNFSQAE